MSMKKKKIKSCESWKCEIKFKIEAPLIQITLFYQRRTTI